MSTTPDPIDPNDPMLGLGEESAPAEVDRYSMDPAQQSLAEALRITYRILQVVMLLLVVLFLGSGFQTIGASERGVKLTFGKVTVADVPPGSVWNWPYPVGEVVKVSTSQQRQNVRRSFFPELTPEQEQRPREQIAGAKPTLIPGVDGSLITADGNIAHTRWEIAYRIDRAAEYINNIYQPDERDIILAAVERGVVRAIAEQEIDSLLRQVAASDDSGVTGVSSLSTRVRIIAQDTLDQVNSGIVIEDVILTDRMAPLAVYKVFNEVTTAASNAARERETATQYKQSVLNAAAGQVHGALIEAIDEYELALATGNDALANERLDRINYIIDGGKVEYQGQMVAISGEAASIMAKARDYRVKTIAEAKSAEKVFKAKHKSYTENPRVFLANELRSAWEVFIEKTSAEVAVFPAGTDLSITLNRDPEIAEELERERNRRQADQTVQQRVETQREAQKQRERQGNNDQ